MSQKICVLGLGLMGRRAVVRLVERGHEVVAWNRTRGSHLDEIGNLATLAASPYEAVLGAPIVLLFLNDAEAVSDVLLNRQTIARLEKGAFVADMGTNTPEMARRVASQISSIVHFVDAPVSGGTKGAEHGSLSIFLGAVDQDVSLARSALGDLGRITHMGGVGSGQAAKLANQIFIACSIAGLAEGVAYGEALGIAPDVLLAAMRGGLADSQVLDTIGARISAGDFSPSGRASTHLKDLDYAFSQIKGGGKGLCAAAAAREHLTVLIKNFGDLDHSAMVLTARAALTASMTSVRAGSDTPQQQMERQVNESLE